jgi:hypothetical protein
MTAGAEYIARRALVPAIADAPKTAVGCARAQPSALLA